MNRKKLKNIEQLLESLSIELHGQYTEYSEDMVIITVPVNDDESKFQSVKGYVADRKTSQNETAQMVMLSSTVCTLHDHPELDFKELLKKNYYMIYSKLTITDEDYLEVEAATRYEYATAQEVEAMIEEVARKTEELKQELLGAKAN
ncbi:hypothetical protein [Microscilla marina]|uniref:Uncharacterized protein n=1 Tax=Microscilla marina ATCC 23134 TaxID=313606 RepID=A1ZZF7_MICM2|nr:hypothetical protein [Microscilla marina]EAY24256.1 hypothetical protein M23134_06358 [Microscilla marina ATCC 23134]